jgi:hypothetical protein
VDELQNVGAYLGLGGAFVVVALVEAVKRTVELPEAIWKRFIPALSLILGVLWNVLVLRLVGPTPTVETVIFLGLATGLSAMGLWSGGKSISGG